MFFFVHIYTNSTALNGPAIFNKHVQDIHDIPYLLLIEIFGIFIPLLFHSVYGVLISCRGEAERAWIRLRPKLVLHFPAGDRYLSFLFPVVSYSEFPLRVDPGAEFDPGGRQCRQGVFDRFRRISEDLGAGDLLSSGCLRQRGIWLMGFSFRGRLGNRYRRKGSEDHFVREPWVWRSSCRL